MSLTKVNVAMIDGPIVNVEGFGAIGDGTTDDTNAVRNALTAAAGGTIYFGTGKTYRVTDELVPPANTTVDLSGSKVLFEITGATRCFDLRDGVTICNGSIELNGSSFSGHGGYGAPIVVGSYLNDDGRRGYKNVRIENLTIEGNRPDGNGIFVTSDSSQVVIKNIRFPASEYMGRCILVHWGGTDGAGVNGTLHPSNVFIENIRSEGLTYAGAGETNVVFISASTNIEIHNVEITSDHEDSIIYLYAGDFGWLYADSFSAAMGFGGVNVSNVRGICRFGVNAQLANVTGSVQAWPAQVNLKQIQVQSEDKTVYPSCGVRLGNVTQCVIESCRFDSMYYGIFFDNNVSNVTVKDCVISNSYAEGFYAIDSTAASNIIIDSCRFEDNNTSGGASIPDIRMRYVDTATINNNVFDSTDCNFSVRIDSNAPQASNIRITNNLVSGIKATGVCFSIGDLASILICNLFNGNVATSVPSGGFQGGQAFIPHEIVSDRAGENYIMRYNTFPSAGTWRRGDIVYDITPSAGGSIGWVCTADGTPGTWKTFGSISA